MQRKSGFVAIAGRPNAGKSTLLNRVLGSSLSIVTDKAQTTRENVLGILTEPEGQIVFIDTPGIHKAKEGGINAYMMDQARGALADATAVWYLVDPKSAPKHELSVVECLTAAKIPTIVIFNKMDLISGKGNRELVAAFANQIVVELESRGVPVIRPTEGDARMISAANGKGVDDLLKETWAKLSPGDIHYPDEEQVSDRPMRFFVGEKIREQLLLQLGEELPYSCAVQIEKYDESVKPLRIEAVIHVERDSQKGMVIGKGGAKIKSIGSEARIGIEELIGQKVFLGLKVNVLKDWSRDTEQLKRLGYFLA